MSETLVVVVLEIRRLNVFDTHVVDNWWSRLDKHGDSPIIDDFCTEHL